MMFAASGLFGQEWLRVYGGAGFDYGYMIAPISDGGFYTAGLQAAQGSMDRDFWVARFDADGNKLWDTTYGKKGITETLFSFNSASGDGFMVGGFSGVQFSGTESALMYRGDTTGKVLWTIDVNYHSSDHWHFGFERRGGGYFLGGHTDSKEDPKGDMWLARFDDNRNMVWEKTYDRGFVEHAHSGVQTRDGGLILGGHTSVGDMEKYWLVKVDSNGTMQWQKVYSSSNMNHDSPYRVIETREGNYAVFGGSGSAHGSGGTIWLLVVDSTGKIIVDKHLGDPASDSFSWSGRQTSDGGYIISGYTSHNTKGEEDIYVIKTKADGTVEWDSTFGGNGPDFGYDVIETTDGYFVCGLTGSGDLMTGGEGDLVVLKIAKKEVTLPLPSQVTLVAPAANAILTDTTAMLRWGQGNPAVTRYQLELATDAAFTQKIVDSSLTDTSTLRTQLMNGGTYWWRVRASNATGWGPFSEARQFTVTKGASVGDRESLGGLALHQNIPNPFGATTTFRFTQGRAGTVRMALLDLAGREVATICDDRFEAGEHAVELDASTLPAGVYVCRMTADGDDGAEAVRSVIVTVVR